MTRCTPVEIVPWSLTNCKEEIPALMNGTEIFVDPISYVIMSAGSPIHCDDITPLSYKLEGKWYCSYQELRECHDPAMMLVDEVQIEGLQMNDIGLGKSIYMKKQLDEFVTFLDIQGMVRAYLAETAELIYIGRNEKGEWGLAMGAQAQNSMIHIIGMSFIPLYTVIGPFVFLLSLLLMV